MTVRARFPGQRGASLCRRSRLTEGRARRTARAELSTHAVLTDAPSWQLGADPGLPFLLCDGAARPLPPSTSLVLTR
jgi:hypothetical protein